MNYLNRHQAVLKYAARHGCDAFLVTDPIDLYYLTGLDLSSGSLILREKTAGLVVDGRYFEACSKKCPVPLHLLKPEGITELVQGVKKLGVDSEKITLAAYLTLKSQGDRVGFDVEPIAGVLGKVRSIKESLEIEALRRAARLGIEGFEHIKALLQEGIQEKELVQKLDLFWKNKGAEGCAFDPIIAFGANSSMPHYRSGEAQLKKGDVVLIDLGVRLNHYNSDMTRTLFFEGHQELEKIHSIVKEAFERALAVVKPGVSIAEVDDAARLHISSKGYGEHFTHSLGHGIGLDVHEYPTLRRNSATVFEVLEPGMAITIEPGIYLPGIGGIRHEDTLVVTETGYENLTSPG